MRTAIGGSLGRGFRKRVTIFDSDLFHRTADLDFGPGYENRRVNVTMLFGYRSAG